MSSRRARRQNQPRALNRAQEAAAAWGALYDADNMLSEGMNSIVNAHENASPTRRIISEDSPFAFEFDEPYANQNQERLGRPFAGYTVPQEWTLAGRREVLMRAHLVWERDPMAKGAVRLIRSFVVGNGLSVAYRSKEAKEAIQGFIEQPLQKFKLFERQLFDQLLIDGELFLHFLHAGEQGKLDATTRVLPIKPWNVDYIITAPGDYQARLEYVIRQEVGTGQPGYPHTASAKFMYLKSDEVLHAPINNLAYEMRGRSELFTIFPWLRTFREWLENRARINRYKGILYHLQLKNAPGNIVQAKQSQFRQPIRPASIYVSSDLEELKSVGANVDAGDVSQDGRMMRLMSAVSLGLPEYMLADGSNANLASATAQQLPALKTFEDYQDYYTDQVWVPIFQEVLRWTYGDEALNYLVPEVNELGEQVNDHNGLPSFIKLKDSFNCSFPSASERRPRDLAAALQIAAEMGWVSAETASQQMGYDYALEVKRGAKRQENPKTPGVPGAPVGAQPTGKVKGDVDNEDPRDTETQAAYNSNSRGG